MEKRNARGGYWLSSARKRAQFFKATKISRLNGNQKLTTVLNTKNTLTLKTIATMISPTIQISNTICTNEIERLILPHRKLMFNRALKLCKNPDFAEDLVQEAVYLGMKNIKQLKDHSKSKYWLLTILTNQFFKEYSKKKITESGNDEEYLCNLLDKKFPEKEFLEEELDQEIRFLVESLEEKLRTPIKMFYFQNFLYREISVELNIAIGTVMSRISRAKACLKMKLLERSDFLN